MKTTAKFWARKAFAFSGAIVLITGIEHLLGFRTSMAILSGTLFEPHAVLMGVIYFFSWALSVLIAPAVFLAGCMLILIAVISKEPSIKQDSVSD
jgi:hypothetical protein